MVKTGKGRRKRTSKNSINPTGRGAGWYFFSRPYDGDLIKWEGGGGGELFKPYRVQIKKYKEIKCFSAVW